MEGLEEIGKYIGYAAGALTVISFLPQVLRVWRTRATHDLSRTTFILLLISGVMWLVYGFARSDWPVIATNSGLVLMNGSLLLAKIKYR
jgi:MtN3 and saliva related transmembrane protein